MNLPARVRRSSPGTRAGCCWLLVACLHSLFLTGARTPAEAQRCFDADVPGQVCIAGEFLLFWEQHGGLLVFGEPVTEATVEATPDGRVTVQYFDQARLELHPENAAPYDVLIGRLGAERLRDTESVAGVVAPTTTAECVSFPATNRAVCDLFLGYWRAHGLQLGDPGISDRESLGLLGLPLTGPMIETGPDGAEVMAQWFERTRLVVRDGTVVATPVGRERAGSGTGAPAGDRPTTGPVGSPATESVAPTPSPEPTSAPQAQSTPVPTTPIAPASLPMPGPPCNQDIPLPDEGLQLWVTIPEGDEDQAVACVRLILQGAAVAGASAIVHREYGGETRSGNPQTTGQAGTAGFIFYVGPGSPGMPDNVQAVVQYRGETYRATTWLKKSIPD